MTESEKKCQEELVALKNEFEEFVYIVSHDIKTPMRAISNITTWIEDDLGSNADKEILDNFRLLKNRVERLENMMNALLELSRVNRSEMELYEVNIPKLVMDSIEMIEDKSNVEFHFTYHLKNEKAVTLGKKMQKVLFSLLDNAVRFHDKEKKNVFVEVSENETDYEIKVSDDGPGIPEGVRDKIFSIFYTVNSKDIVDSTGAGLAISSKIIKMVGGAFQYAPGLNSGSIFKFNWPKQIRIKN
ncbi:sensor histidine kinase [Flavobacterium sp. XS2P12]|uniref:sensor histidine kinase n=1 Tax=Flavobacterium melibiosi TaxID=3398734 RepID=UPI003A89CBB5